jgi:dynein light chain roadblock-type
MLTHTRLQANGQEALDEMLGRLSKKPGVKATVVLDRTTGAILTTSGQISSLRSGLPTQTTGSFSAEPGSAQNDESQGVEEFAAKVWGFVQGAGGLVEELDTEVGHGQCVMVCQEVGADSCRMS